MILWEFELAQFFYFSLQTSILNRKPLLSTTKFTSKHDPPFHQAPKQQTKLQNAFSSLARSSLEFYLAHPFSPRICFHHTLSKTSEKSTCTDDSLRRSRYLYVYVCVPANVYFNVLACICMNVLVYVSANALMCVFSVHAQLCFWLVGSRTFTARAHLRLAGSRTFTFTQLCFCFSSALFVGVRFDIHKEKAVANCACAQNFAFATATQLRICKRRGRRLHKTIRSQAQTHMNVHANADARSVAFGRARPLCGQSLPLLPIATAGAQNAPASFSLVSLRSDKKEKKQLSKTAAKSP